MNYPDQNRRWLCAALLLAACGGDPDDTTGTTGTAGTTADTSTSTTGASASTDAPTDTSAATTSTTDPSTTGTTTGGAADCGFDPDHVFDRLGAVFQLQSKDGDACVWFERRDDSEPGTIYKAIPYTLLEFKVGHEGALVHVTDLAALTWESTHHNWTDVATAEADGVRYRLADLWASDEGGESFVVNKWALSASDAVTDAPLWGPILVYPWPE